MAIVPPATIGILGGGQLGRMTALAARSLGFSVQVLDPNPDCAARPVADRVIAAAFDDANAASELARTSQVVTLEIEQIPRASLEILKPPSCVNWFFEAADDGADVRESEDDLEPNLPH